MCSLLLPAQVKAEWSCPDSCNAADDGLGVLWQVDTMTGAVGGLGGATDEMFLLEVDGVPFEAMGLPSVDFTTDNLILGPVTSGALSIRRHYRLIPGVSQLRVGTELINTGAIPVAVSLVMQGQHAVGSSVDVALTSSGDDRVDGWDRWMQLDDGEADATGLPDLLIASDGVGTCPVAATDVDLHPDGTLEWYYVLSVPGGAQVKLMHLIGLALDDDGALLGLSALSSTPAPLWAVGLPGTGPVLNWLVDDDDGDRVVDVLSLGEDCDDTRSDVYPGAEEVCDLTDNDCDGLIDEGVTTLYFRDEDADGYGVSLSPAAFCFDVVGWASLDGDCDDSDASIHPGAAEVCDGEDNNCNGFPDEGVALDLDGDGQIADSCGGLDCDDGNSGVFFGAAERCDGLDNDCDGSVDDVDLDEDGWVDSQCGGEDCDDLAHQIHPGARELCNGWDDDCDTLLDDLDLDGDGVVSEHCTGGRDCDDADPMVHPGVVEDCGDLSDNDCDGLVDAADDQDCVGASCSMAGRMTPEGIPMLVLLLLLGRLSNRAGRTKSGFDVGAGARRSSSLSATLHHRARNAEGLAEVRPASRAIRPNRMTS